MVRIFVREALYDLGGHCHFGYEEGLAAMRKRAVLLICVSQQYLLGQVHCLKPSAFLSDCRVYSR